VYRPFLTRGCGRLLSAFKMVGRAFLTNCFVSFTKWQGGSYRHSFLLPANALKLQAQYNSIPSVSSSCGPRQSCPSVASPHIGAGSLAGIGAWAIKGSTWWGVAGLLRAAGLLPSAGIWCRSASRPKGELLCSSLRRAIGWAKCASLSLPSNSLFGSSKARSYP